MGVFLDTTQDANGDPPKDKPYYGYVDVMILLAGTSMLGTALNVWLYIDDKKNRGGVLDRIHGKESVTAIIKNMDDPLAAYPY